MKKRIKFQDLSRLHKTIEVELKNVFETHLNNSQFMMGEAVAGFEKEFGSFCKATYTLAVGNGTDALEMVLECLQLEPGTAVIVPSMTFAATAEAVVRQGLVPVFCDVDEDSLCLTESHVQSAIENHKGTVSAVIAVHLYGQVVNLSQMAESLKSQNIVLIEDAAQAHGAQNVGQYGIAATYSFFPGKNLGALGDAGAITTTDKTLYDRLTKLRDHGRESKYVHTSVGRNSRMDALQASFLRVKLNKLKEWTENRRLLAHTYAKYLAEIPGIQLLPFPRNMEDHVFHLLVVRVTPRFGRDQLALQLKELGIETGVHYPLALHAQPAFSRWVGADSFPVSQKASEEVLSLPMDPLHHPEDIQYVCDSIRSILR